MEDTVSAYCLLSGVTVFNSLAETLVLELWYRFPLTVSIQGLFVKFWKNTFLEFKSSDDRKTILASWAESYYLITRRNVTISSAEFFFIRSETQIGKNSSTHI